MPNCALCQKEFELPTRKHGYDKIYCSLYCRAKQNRQRQLRKKRANKIPAQPVGCLICFSLFIPKTNVNRFCSEKCRRKVENERARKRAWPNN